MLVHTRRVQIPRLRLRGIDHCILLRLDGRSVCHCNTHGPATTERKGSEGSHDTTRFYQKCLRMFGMFGQTYTSSARGTVNGLWKGNRRSLLDAIPLVLLSVILPSTDVKASHMIFDLDSTPAHHCSFVTIDNSCRSGDQFGIIS
jgi:hypothetical protein